MKRSSSKSKASSKAKAKKPGGRVLDANKATFEQLRGLGMSVTQATRVIAYRERAEGFESIDDLDTVPGFPKALLDRAEEEADGLGRELPDGAA